MNLDSRSKIHLLWMFENQPERVRKLHDSGELEGYLEAKYQKALARVDYLKQNRGMSEEEGFEAATRKILAPANGPATSNKPPTPIPWDEQKAIMDCLDPDT
jgi:hypothetical protein